MRRNYALLELAAVQYGMDETDDEFLNLRFQLEQHLLRVVASASNLSVPSHPDIFVVGDTDAVTDQPGIPGTAPPAKQTGRYVGRLIAARVADGPSPTAIRLPPDQPSHDAGLPPPPSSRIVVVEFRSRMPRNEMLVDFGQRRL
jgi:hypothetical protein